MGFLDHLIESLKYRRRREPDLSLRQVSYHSSSTWGSEYKVLVRNKGGSTAFDVQVALLLDGDEMDATSVNVPGGGEEAVRLRVPAERCTPATPGEGHRALGDLRFEARLSDAVVGIKGTA